MGKAVELNEKKFEVPDKKFGVPCGAFYAKSAEPRITFMKPPYKCDNCGEVLEDDSAGKMRG